MKPVEFGAFLILTSGLMCVWATVGGQYSINVHFVPPLVSGACPVANFWNPENITCGLCFCMTGTLSRCIPRPGCNPNNATTTTTTPSSTSDGSTTPTTVVPSETPVTQASVPTTAVPEAASTVMSNFV